MKMNDRAKLEPLMNAIRTAREVWVFPHVDPDGDALGSALALKMLIERLDKPVSIIMESAPPEKLSFLPGIESVVGIPQAPIPPDVLALSIDVSTLERLGEAEKVYTQATVSAQMDHHETNPGFAMINYIDGAAASSASLVFRLFSAFEFPLRQEEAVNLYVGLSTDTGNFMFQNTDAESFRIMAQLIEAGLDIARYSRMIFLRKDRPFLTLLGKALPTIRYLNQCKIAGMRLDQKTLTEVDPGAEYTEGIVNYAINAGGVRLAYLAREREKGDIKCSLRALPPYRVDEVAQHFGGGGHRLAAGCTLRMTLDEAVDTIEKALLKACAEAEAVEQ